MKIKTLVFVYLILFVGALRSQEVFTYGPDEQTLMFYRNNDYIYLTIRHNLPLTERTAIESQLLNLLGADIVQVCPQFMYKVRKLNDLEFMLKNDLGQDTNKIFLSSILYFKGDSTIQWGTQSVFVKTSSYNELVDVLISENIQYAEIEPFEDNLFLVSLPGLCDKSIYVANRLYESGLVVFAEPNFGKMIKPASNPNFNSQWGFNNTGQFGGMPGIDINVESAWMSTKGENIKVAVLDEGVELTHPDLYENIVQGYDALQLNNNGACNAADYHGTCCAGIIAAADNDIYVIGVAPKSKIIPIRIAYKNNDGDWICYYNWINNAIEKAFTTYNADVLSCSWGGGSASHSTNIKIYRATTLGRNGKGCVFTFSSMNGDTNVAYPANLPEVVAVGAISQCGERKSPTSCDNNPLWGSNYGSALSLVAPGSNNIYTTTVNSDIKCNFGGTSAACPHVAGVVALMLSANPNLTSKQAIDIIEQTARKIRTDRYVYTLDNIHLNGTWNDSVGYGLVDAYAAVKKAKDIDLYIRDSVTDNGTMPSNVAFNWDSPDIWLEDLSGNRVENPTGNTYYNVCVRIHNHSDYPSTGDERLFLNWAKAGINDYWYENWTSYNPLICDQHTAYKGGAIDSPNGILLSSIPAHSSKIEKVLWRTPLWEDYVNCSNFTDDPWHFCLLARVHDYETIAHENEQQTGVYWLVRDHNNVAQKNINLNKGASHQSVMSISNPTSNSITRFLRLLKRQNIFEEKITDFAEISLTLNADLISAINYDLLTGAKFVNDNTLLITDEDFVLPLQLTAGQYSTLSTSVNFFTNKTPQNDTTHFDIVAYADEDLSEIAGGQGYNNIYTAGRTFHANAGNDTAILIGTTATLHATQINEDATYRWYDKQRNFLYEGVNYSVVPSHTSEYILEVTAESDGYRDLDTVKVNVVPGCIRSITPNPVSDNWVTVSYEYATTVTSAQLLIYNTATTALVGNYDLSNMDNVSSLDIEVTNYPTGSYTVVLVCDNAICHSKILIRQ